MLGAYWVITLTKKDTLVAMAEDFASFLISEGFTERHKVRNIVLYGSVPRGDFTVKSDVDVFVDAPNPKRAAEAEMKRLVDEFYESIWFTKWRRLGVDNGISCIVGDISEWDDLHRSIVANNLLLYGKYVERLGGLPMSLIAIESAKPESKRISVFRAVFGYSRYGKRYKGLMEKNGGEKLAKGCFLVPIENSRAIIDFLRAQKVGFTIREVELTGRSSRDSNAVKKAEM